jgi:hypothetical protein
VASGLDVDGLMLSVMLGVSVIGDRNAFLYSLLLLLNERPDGKG